MSHSSNKQNFKPDDSLDRVFVNCLNEIEKTYLILPKTQRIRVEKWLVKLTCAGSNTTWRRSRNSYAKLLMNMVISRNISEPFHTSPPEGSLPQFPNHLKSHSKHLLGAHETSFWRGLYHQVGESMASAELLRQDGPGPQEGVDEGGFQDSSTASGDNGRKSPSKRYSSPSRNSSENQSQQYGNSVEIQNLNFLIKEQGHRIQLLEMQLHEERVKHELELQRMQLTHRIEIAKVRKDVSVVEQQQQQQQSYLGSTRSHNDVSHVGWDQRRQPSLSLSSPVKESGYIPAGTRSEEYAKLQHPHQSMVTGPMTNNTIDSSRNIYDHDDDDDHHHGNPFLSSAHHAERLKQQTAPSFSLASPTPVRPSPSSPREATGNNNNNSSKDNYNLNPWVLSEESNFPRVPERDDSYFSPQTQERQQQQQQQQSRRLVSPTVKSPSTTSITNFIQQHQYQQQQQQQQDAAVSAFQSVRSGNIFGNISMDIAPRSSSTSSGAVAAGPVMAGTGGTGAAFISSKQAQITSFSSADSMDLLPTNNKNINDNFFNDESDVHRHGPSADENFLKYIERFQKDISVLGATPVAADHDLLETRSKGEQHQEQKPHFSLSLSPSRSQFAEDYLIND